MTTVPDAAFRADGHVATKYLAFLETVATLRPALHRYCARMCGSVIDGEDIAQDVLFEAFRRLASYDESRPLRPWILRIAYTRSIDFLRREQVRRTVESAHAPAAPPAAVNEAVVDAPAALESLIATLPPMERACLVLKDVLDYSLAEIADVVDSNVGAVKAALHRGRSRLREATPPARPPRPLTREQLDTLRRYTDRFARCDWEGLREVVRADARVTVVDRFDGPLTSSPYLVNSERSAGTWSFALAVVDAETVLLRRGTGGAPYSVCRLSLGGDRIAAVRDYVHCPWMLDHLLESPRLID